MPEGTSSRWAVALGRALFPARPGWLIGLLWAAVLALSAPVAAAESRALDKARLRIHCETPALLSAWQRFAAGCVAEVEEAIGPPGDTLPTLTVRFGAAARSTTTPATNPFVLDFAAEAPIEVVTHELLSALLRRQVTDPGAARPPRLPATGWLAAALTNRVLFGQRERYGRVVPDFEPARFAFQRGAYPDIERLLESPVSPGQTIPYRLYALHCDLLALCVCESTDLEALSRLVALDASGRAPAEALAFVLAESLAPGEALQSWYQRTAEDVSRRGRRPSDTESVAMRFETLASVPVVAPGEHDFRGQRQPLEEVPGSLAGLADDAEARHRLLREFFELVKDAPMLLQQPLAQYADACQDLGSSRQRSVRSAMRKARAGVEAALARQRLLDAWLDEQERRFIPAEKRFALPLDVVRRAAQAERDWDPALHRRLDEPPP